MIHNLLIMASLFTITCILIIAVTTKGWVRLTVVGVFLPFLALSFYTVLDSYGQAKPVAFEFAKATNAEVLSFYSHKEEEIFLFLLLPEQTAPKLYVLPWDLEVIKQLRDARASYELAKEKVANSKIIINKPFDNYADKDERVIHALPITKLPEKTPFDATTILTMPEKRIP